MTSATRPTCLALDIGGTKIEAALVASDGTLTNRERLTTAGHVDLFAAVSQLIALVRGDSDVMLMGVGCGGPMHGRGTSVSPLNIPEWREFPLHDRLHELWGATIAIDNDAKALALGERFFGSAQQDENFLSMVVSTGIGGGIVLNGQLLDGRDGNAGHIGHVVVVPDGRLCACGARGCLEAEASGTAIAEMTGQPAELAPSSVRERTGDLVGRAVTSVAALLDLERCYIAGSVALGFGDVFFNAANAAVREHAHIEHARHLRISPSLMGSNGPLLGAACVAWRSDL